MKKQKNMICINWDNEYSKNDSKANEAGVCRYLNFIAIILKKK